MRFRCGAVAIGLIVLAWPASAHHSHGLYKDTFTDLQGVVKEVHLLVPHSFVYIEVKPPTGEAQSWALEGTSRSGLERIGVTKDYLQAGDTIKVRCHALRDGTNGCLLGYVSVAGAPEKIFD